MPFRVLIIGVYKMILPIVNFHSIFPINIIGYLTIND